MRPVKRPRAATALLLALAAVPAAATDTLIMQNDDRVTGTISTIWDGKVHIDPPYADEIQVVLDKVKTIDARRDFEFETWTGEKFTGQIGLDGAGNQVVVRDGREMPLDLATIEELAEPEAPFAWSARADVNGNNSTGNAESASLLVQAHGMVRFGDHRHEGDVQLDYQSTDETRVKERLAVRYDYNWLYDDHWYLAAPAFYERDPIRDLDRRVALGGAVGHQCFDDAHRFFRVSLGPAAVNEVLGGDETTSASALWGLEFRHKFHDNRFEFFHRHSYLSIFGSASNQVLKASNGLPLEITDDIYTNLQFDYDHESAPAPDRDSTDTRFLLGVGIKHE